MTDSEEVYSIEIENNGKTFKLSDENLSFSSSTNFDIIAATCINYTLVFIERLRSIEPDRINLLKPLHITIKKGQEIIASTASAFLKNHDESLKLRSNNKISFVKLSYYLLLCDFFKRHGFNSTHKALPPLLFLFAKKQLDITIKVERPLRIRIAESLAIVSYEDRNYKLRQEGISLEEKRISSLQYLPSEIVNLLLDPLWAIKSSNIQSKVCCFCSRELTSQDSLVNGYGRSCASSYNLPYFEV